MVAASAEAARLRVRVLAQVVKEAGVGNLLRRVPLGLELRERMIRAFRIGCSNSHKVAVVDDLDIG